jgi:alkylated DNA repair dioxygenase AlkB
MTRLTLQAGQSELFGSSSVLPSGFKYQPALLSTVEEQQLLRSFVELSFKEFEFHGFLGKRRVVSFGWRYDFNQGGLQKTEDIPQFLLPVRDLAAGFAGMPPAALQQVLLTEYPAGATIGWHKDRAVFGEVIGISLLSPCVFRFRRKIDKTWQRASFIAEPRSGYLLRGPARTEWEHSIPAVERLRYSITFRNFRSD